MHFAKVDNDDDDDDDFDDEGHLVVDDDDDYDDAGHLVLDDDDDYDDAGHLVVVVHHHQVPEAKAAKDVVGAVKAEPCVDAHGAAVDKRPQVQPNVLHSCRPAHLICSFC